MIWSYSYDARSGNDMAPFEEPDTQNLCLQQTRFKPAILLCQSVPEFQ